MHSHEFRAYANSFLVFLFFLTFNIFTNDFLLLKNMSKASAVTATILIAITLLLGPLSRFFPKQFRYDLVYRKPLGLAGFGFAVIHATIVFFNTYNTDLFYIFSESNPNFIPVVYGTVALLILIALACTSAPKSIKNMGFEKWKTFQRTGYIALIFVILHFASLGNGYFLKSTIGKTVFALALIALVFKAISIILKKQKMHSSKEIEHLTKL
ncbi:MAG: ferric reductase-like transmembrane domain-containing protein [archaeon]|nr:ferric reductase-like transmembrane domain-containing protein [archaeon]